MIANSAGDAPVPSRHTDDPELEREALHRRYYRWWTVTTWWGPGSGGLKLGPVTVFVFQAPAVTRAPRAPWFWGLMFLGRPVVDTYLEHLRRP